MIQREGKKRDSDSFMTCRMDQCRDDSSFFSPSLAALCLWLNCMDVRTSPKPSMQQEQQPSPQYQSIITSNSLSLFFLSHFSHTDCVNQGLDQEEVVTSVQNEKGCPPAPGPDRQWRDVFVLVIKLQLSLCPLHLHVSVQRF